MKTVALERGLNMRHLYAMRHILYAWVLKSDTVKVCSMYCGRLNCGNKLLFGYTRKNVCVYYVSI